MKRNGMPIEAVAEEARIVALALFTVKRECDFAKGQCAKCNIAPICGGMPPKNWVDGLKED